MSVAELRAVLDVYFAHDTFVSNPGNPEVDDRGTSGDGIALPLSYAACANGGTRTRNPLMEPLPTPPVKVVFESRASKCAQCKLTGRGTSDGGLFAAL
jgi:hypothetical protein